MGEISVNTFAVSHDSNLPTLAELDKKTVKFVKFFLGYKLGLSLSIFKNDAWAQSSFFITNLSFLDRAFDVRILQIFVLHMESCLVQGRPVLPSRKREAEMAAGMVLKETVL